MVATIDSGRYSVNKSGRWDGVSEPWYRRFDMQQRIGGFHPRWSNQYKRCAVRGCDRIPGTMWSGTGRLIPDWLCPEHTVERFRERDRAAVMASAEKRAAETGKRPVGLTCLRCGAENIVFARDTARIHHPKHCEYCGERWVSLERRRGGA